MTNFTPIMSLTGGVIIGLAALLLLLCNGRIAGISGIFAGLLQVRNQDTLWRFTFIAGLLCGGMLLLVFYPTALTIELTFSSPALIIAGLLVGIGSRMGSGCTSGHGICGIGRLSRRSIVAVVTFMITGVVAATVVQQLLGGQL